MSSLFRHLDLCFGCVLFDSDLRSVFRKQRVSLGTLCNRSRCSRRLSPCLPRPINISSVTEDTNEQALRSRARNLGHAAAENSRARAAERLRRQPTPEASVGRYPPSERRLALPSPAQARTRGLDHRRMEDLRKGPPRKILLAYPNGTPPA